MSICKSHLHIRTWLSFQMGAFITSGHPNSDSGLSFTKSKVNLQKGFFFHKFISRTVSLASPSYL